MTEAIKTTGLAIHKRTPYDEQVQEVPGVLAAVRRWSGNVGFLETVQDLPGKEVREVQRWSKPVVPGQVDRMVITDSSLKQQG